MASRDDTHHDAPLRENRRRRQWVVSLTVLLWTTAGGLMLYYPEAWLAIMHHALAILIAASICWQLGKRQPFRPVVFAIILFPVAWFVTLVCLAPVALLLGPPWD